jgi:hypothetical protein
MHTATHLVAKPGLKEVLALSPQPRRQPKLPAKERLLTAEQHSLKKKNKRRECVTVSTG